MRIKPIHIIVALLFIGLLSLAIYMENKAYDQCMEVLTHPECVKVFG
jgi:hypothetical protein